MLWLALAVACSVTLAMLLKLVERRGLDRAAVLAVNYAAGLALAAALARGDGRGLSPGAAALGAATGALFIAGFYVFGAAIRRAGVGLSTGVMRLSVVVPVLGAWALWGEAPTAGQGAGLALAGAAFFLLARPAPPVGRGAGPDAEGAAGDGGRALAVLALLFLAGGAVDLALKGFAEAFAATSGQPAFLLVVFGVATAIGAALVLARGLRGGGWPRRAEYAVGAVLGVVNYGSADFLLRAAGALPAALVFPTNAVAVVGLAAALAVTVWGERLSRANLAGLALAAAALALLWGDRP